VLTYRIVVRPRIPLPKRAAALRLRAHMLSAGLSAPHRRITAFAEVAAGVATAGVLAAYAECRGVHCALLRCVGDVRQYDSLRSMGVLTTRPR